MTLPNLIMPGPNVIDPDPIGPDALKRTDFPEYSLVVQTKNRVQQHCALVLEVTGEEEKKDGTTLWIKMEYRVDGKIIKTRPATKFLKGFPGHDQDDLLHDARSLAISWTLMELASSVWGQFALWIDLPEAVRR